jgi:hypothetical protein
MSAKATGFGAAWRILRIRSTNLPDRRECRSVRLWSNPLEGPPWDRSTVMVTTAAFVGVLVVLIGLALSAYAIYLTNGRDEPRFRGL